MKFRLHSDLHLEAFAGRDAKALAAEFVPAVPTDVETTLFLAGDVSSHGLQIIELLKVCAQRFRHVVYVPGNHEFYKKSYDRYSLELRDAIEALELANVHAAVNEVRHLTIDGVEVIFGTLWGDGGPTLADRGQVGWYLNDFRLIRKNTHADMSHSQVDRLFTVSDMVAIYQRDKREIDRLLREAQGRKSIVMTHHLPSRRLVAKRFWPTDGSDGANGGFVGSCEDILAYDHAPTYWLHGHTHDYISTALWQTQVLCNPTGYRGEWGTGLNGGRVEVFEV